jgi:hypothetical protein
LYLTAEGALIQLAAVLVFSGQLAVAGQVQMPPRDRVPPPRTGTGVVKGKVVDGTTGTAIARARVIIQGASGGTPATTDADGNFMFTGLPAGPVMLMVQKSTYLPARFPAAGRTLRSQTRPLVLRDAQVLDNVVVPMFHGASISGRVFDANGDPLDGAQVTLLRLPAGGRSGKPVMNQGTQSNDVGEFRIGRLEAGTYLVQVTARRENEGAFSANGSVPQPPPAAQPLPTFYPGALAIEQAQPIPLERAQAVTGIDVVLAEGTPGVVSGTVLGADGQPMPANTFPSVMVRRVMSEKVPGWYDYTLSGASTRPDGTFRAVLPPGDYLVEARLMPRTGGGPSRPEDEQVATARVSVVPGGEESLTMMVGPGASAAGRVVFEGTTPPPPSPGRIRVPMTSEGGMCRSGEAEVAADWSFRIRGLNGTCSAQPMGFFGRWTLKAVIVNGENVVDSPVTFQPGQQLRNVQIVVTDRRSSMTFQVADENGQTTREYVAVVYPVDKEHWTNGARTYTPPTITNADALRAITSLPGPVAPTMARPQALPGLRSGDYFVIAVDDLEWDDVRDPAVLDRLRTSATRVTLPEGAALDVSLRRVSFADVMRQK